MPALAHKKAPLLVRVYDGRRELIAPGTRVSFRILDGFQKVRLNRDIAKPVLRVNLPYADNLADRYTVIVSSPGCLQSGFFPVELRPGVLTTLDLMLLPRQGAFRFHQARWDQILSQRPKLAALLMSGESGDGPRRRYEDLMENQPAALACLLNLVETMDSILLPNGTPLDYLKAIIWDGAEAPAPDRFFAWTDPELVQQVARASAQGAFQQVPLPGLFHPGATRSFKEVRFAEANLQLTFHEGSRRRVGGVNCVKVETDMDYFRDPLAHTFLEVLPNRFGGQTDPRQIYLLRWMAGRRAAVAEFQPPYTIEA